jgi:glycosyltransferase involved in cell wall biosynthesis
MVAYTTYSVDNRVRREAEALVASGEYRVLVLTLKEGPSPRNYQLKGVEVREMNMSKYQGRNLVRYLILYLRFTLMAFLSCNMLLINKSLDVVHIHNMPNFFVFSAIIPFFFGKKIILDIHDIVLETFLAKFGERSSILKKIILQILRVEEFISCTFAHKVICTNHLQRELLVKRGIPERKIIIIFNTPDPRIFSRSKTVEINPKPKKEFKIIYHGTITKRLGLDLAIRAVISLADRIPCLDFTILGGGEDVKELTALSRDLGGQEVIHFESPVPGEELVKILSRMDLGIVPNNKNIATDVMLPVKMLECVALDIPVIVPRVKVIEHYFSDDMVTYFEPGNVESLANSILNVYNNENGNVNKVENAKSFLKQYGWETHKFDLINLYKNLS